ncbi:hypothetical protein N656DRAFT_776692 [Canariomyces notabilis]|uniref:Uncharacterized protein n=1 Tax=Canariomyces notabilis TaxID=2074819 RepID=A0AAN6THH7_9PEZI|nr:hypothetical protein N656DRAFT_776692 [Canariomyces arenarius]
MTSPAPRVSCSQVSWLPRSPSPKVSPGSQGLSWLPRSLLAPKVSPGSQGLSWLPRSLASVVSGFRGPWLPRSPGFYGLASIPVIGMPFALCCLRRTGGTTKAV